MIRQKKTISGPLLEVDFYPVWPDGRRMPTRAPRSKPTRAEMVKYNRQRAVKKMIRLVNANFGADDYLMSPTYEQSCAPSSEEEAKRDLVNYLRRVKTRRAAALREVEQLLAETPDKPSLRRQREKWQAERDKLAQPMKYIYTMEKVTYQTGKKAGQSNYHFHLFLTGGLPRRELEEMWPRGMRTNVDRYQPDRFGPEAAARYQVKDPAGSKRFVCSRNLDKPKEPTPKDDRISRRGVQRIAELHVDDAAYWEKKYPGYRFVRCFARYNAFNGHWYVSAIMYRNNAGLPPPWSDDGWLDDL
ncbi:MAG: hypothetical protein IJE00_01320 [Clostridia bacterium]|nr:hypothetical protein [Clostridia bacterium]